MKMTPKSRIESIDLLRGVIMIIMALDHVRHYVHYSAFWFDPTDPENTTWAIYLTRWITHYCAPTFCFLAGLSAWFSGRSKTKAQLTAFLFSRGLWLVLMECTLVSFCWTFDIRLHSIALLVIWSLGWGMMWLAVVLYLPWKWLLYLSLAVICTHNLFDDIELKGNLLWAILHQGGFTQYGGDRELLIGYPLIPWVAVMSLGYCFGPLYQTSFSAQKRKKILLRAGLGTTALFFILRGVNLYGDSSRWVHWGTPGQTVMDFMDPGKYPPSLLFLCMTLGPALIFLSLTEALKGRWVSVISTYGRVPFFYYVAHILVIHLVAMGLAQLIGPGAPKMIMHSWITFEEGLRGFGLPLWGVYVVWVLILFALYPLCVWFDGVKLRNKSKWWASYV